MPKIYEYFGAEKPVTAYFKDIIEKWTAYFILRKKLKSIKITKKL